MLKFFGDLFKNFHVNPAYIRLALATLVVVTFVAGCWGQSVGD